MLANEASPLTVVTSPRFPAVQLPRMLASSHEAVRVLIDTASPAVFTLGAEQAGVGRLLSPGDLRRGFQDKSVTVSASQDGAYRSEPGAKVSGRRMPFADFAALVENPDHQSRERLYLAQFPLDIIPVILEPEVATPAPYVPDGSAMVSNNLWFGPAGTISPLHFDRSNNLLHQHHGHKHVAMVNPSYFHPLKPGEKNGVSPHVSALNLVNSGSSIDLSRLGVPCFETTLGPGDILFIPAFWWHHVMSADVAISINYWWRPPIGACLYPGFFRMLSSDDVYRDPSVVTHWVDIAPHRLDTGLCLFLADEGHMFGAAALAGAIVTAFCSKALRMLGIPESLGPQNDAGTDTTPDFAQAAAVVHALAAQGLISSPQAGLLLRWLEIAKETAAEPEPPGYSAKQSAALRDLIWRLHSELGRWLSISMPLS